MFICLDGMPPLIELSGFLVSACLTRLHNSLLKQEAYSSSLSNGKLDCGEEITS
jgi:hypothetical protein